MLAAPWNKSFLSDFKNTWQSADSVLRAEDEEEKRTRKKSLETWDLNLRKEETVETDVTNNN